MCPSYNTNILNSRYPLKSVSRSYIVALKYENNQRDVALKYVDKRISRSNSNSPANNKIDYDSQNVEIPEL